MKATTLIALMTLALILTVGCGDVEQVGQLTSADDTKSASADLTDDPIPGDNNEEKTIENITGESIENDPGEIIIDREIDKPDAQSVDYAPPPPVYDIEGLTYIDGVLIVNKSYSLPSNFGDGLEDICYSQFLKLSAGAAKDDLDIYLSSGFRSWDYQNTIYNNYIDIYGQEVTDTFSARPGHSEHQSGLAIDVNTIDDSFIGTPEAIWLADHAHEYGFIVRYPQDKEDITGYKYEPWHIRYVGTDLSYELYYSGLTMEEYFDIDSYYH